MCTSRRCFPRAGSRNSRGKVGVLNMPFPFPAVFLVRLLAALDVTLANYPASLSASGDRGVDDERMGSSGGNGVDILFLFEMRSNKMVLLGIVADTSVVLISLTVATWG
jgi:hypothetical protein